MVFWLRAPFRRTVVALVTKQHHFNTTAATTTSNKMVIQYNGKAIRQSFVDFFVQKHEHTFVPSSSVVPHEDPTLLFANAGMNQYKSIFLGTVDPNSDFGKLKRAANSQKCIRAGGKHNDLDDVGKDVYHHTFFEMLGNWSFGDFFKKEAISWAWELLTEEWGLEKDRFYATYFGGIEGVPADEEARQFWIDCGIPTERVMPFGMKDNFWEMGDTGPCGPCSELHYDRIGGRDASHLVNMDVPDVLEVWNLVFIQFNREADGTLVPLPNKHVDTGMGLERIVSVIQGKMSNYDTDIFTPFFEEIQKATGVRPYTGLVGDEDKDGLDMAYRVLADHIRTLSVAIADGGSPDNVGRGYVLRRILRRAVRYATESFNAKPGFFASLVDTVVETLGDAFPSLKNDPQFIKDLINEEEAQFLKTLARGRKLFNRAADKSDGSVLAGDVAWRLYDTYGFPLDLTVLMAEERKLAIDMEGYNKSKAHAQEIARAKGSGGEDLCSLDVHALDDLKKKGFAETDQSPKYYYEKATDGAYVFCPATATVVALRMNKEFVDEVPSGNRCGVLLDKSSFYAEQGGQMYDTGFITKEDNQDVEFAVADVQVHGGYVIHIGNLEGTLKVGDKVKCNIDEAARRTLMSNHTATHVLNYALRQVLGDADQRGSLVAPDKLRFDFTAKGAMTMDQVKQTESIMQEVVAKKQKVFAEESSLARAKDIQGLRAIFDEVYPDPVRVVSIGFSLQDLADDPQAGYKTSVEFCGGTHLKNTEDIIECAIVTEEAVAKGIRRIIAVTGHEAQKAHVRATGLETKLSNLRNEVEQQKNTQSLNIKALNQQITALTDEVSYSVIPSWKKDMLREEAGKLKKVVVEADKAVKAEKNKKVVAQAVELAQGAQDVSFIVEHVEDGCNSKSLNTAIQQVQKNNPKLAAMFFSIDHDANKVLCLCQVPKDVVGAKGLKANEWMKSVAAEINGKGGGKELSAQGSGDKLSGLDKAMQLAKEFASLKLS